ncbi:nucleotidyltransferase family protein [Porticoccaceae bacterium]|nr:nucleotidyltransferase family protein [Porticoccaceae bacterium]MDB4260117.1 nucleotidyltransferase family protein [Porticoccaceae bacterium]MDB9805613.1 nucleotidyltransferase family protein [Porticoccaceae bacterium]MDB9970820.1 nucleotidyltransferase family protein [Porticoccaceae bacterium]
MTQQIDVLVLAAGAASRFGSAKQLLNYRGRSLVQHCIDKANRLCPGRVFVVLGANQELIEPLISDAKIIRNHYWQQGLGVSIAAGIDNIDPQSDGLLILLADQVALTTDELNLLLDAFDGSNTVAAHYAGRHGVPAIFPRSLYAELRALSGDSGAKALLQRSDVNITEIDLPNAAMDIDTPEDWAVFLKSLN